MSSNGRNVQLPSREQFLDPENTQGLMLPSDARALVMPAVQAFNHARAETNSNAEVACPICMDDMADLEDVVVTVRCGHIFHRTCLFTWIGNDTQNRSCPYCRQQLFADPIPVQHRRDYIDDERMSTFHDISVLTILVEQGSYRDLEALHLFGIVADNGMEDAEILRRIHAEIARLNDYLQLLAEMVESWGLDEEDEQEFDVEDEDQYYESP